MNGRGSKVHEVRAPPVLCIRHQASAGLGVVASALHRAGLGFVYHDAWRSERAPALDPFSSVIVLGGEMNVVDLGRHPWMRGVRTAVEEALENDLPILGICLGAQTIARVLGARVYPSPVKEVGFKPLAHTPAGAADPVTAPFDGLRVFQWHEDAFELPDGATLLCAGTEVAHQAYRWGRHVYGLQFHCEVDEATIEAWSDETGALEQTWNVTRQELLDEARRFLPAQRAATERAMGAFCGLLQSPARGA